MKVSQGILTGYLEIKIMKIYKDIKKITFDIYNDILNVESTTIEEPLRSTIQIIPESVVRNSPIYIQKVVREINTSYENGCFTACGVLVRRLMETLMIESFERKGLAELIKEDKQYKTAEEIKNKLLENPFGNLSRNARKALEHKKLLGLGHLCAHERYFIARKQDLDQIKGDLRILVEYLVYQSM